MKRARPYLNLSTRALFGLVFLMLPVLVGLIGAEIYVRLKSPYGYVTPELLRSQDLQYAPSLFSRTVFPQKEQRILKKGELEFYVNPLGYRGPSFEATKPAGTVRLMVYGGSAAFDSGNLEGRDWPRLVERRLRQ